MGVQSLPQSGEFKYVGDVFTSEDGKKELKIDLIKTKNILRQQVCIYFK